MLTKLLSNGSSHINGHSLSLLVKLHAEFSPAILQWCIMNETNEVTVLTISQCQQDIPTRPHDRYIQFMGTSQLRRDCYNNNVV